MSYEGYVEYLCERGHYQTVDVYEEGPTKCIVCGTQLRFYHSVDQTNGIVDDDPGTMPAGLDVIGYDDSWKLDHYDNTYAVKILRHCPSPNSAWVRIGKNYEY